MEIQLTLNSYNGDYAPNAVEDGTVEEYGPPTAPIEISQEGDCSAIYLDLGPKEDKPHPSVCVERRPDRWALMIAGEADGDQELIVEILDDGHIWAGPGLTMHIPNLHMMEPRDEFPGPLPPHQCRYGLPNNL